MVKILITGDVNGKIDTIVNKVTKINSLKGSFDLLICVGKFFNNNDISCLNSYIDGSKEWPMETYVVLGGDSLDLDDYISISKINKIHFITKPERKTIMDLDMVFLSGVYSPSIYASDTKSMNNYTHGQIENLIQQCKEKSCQGIDFLFSSEWGLGYYNNLSQDKYPAVPDAKTIGSPIVKDLLIQFKPRYHIAAGNNLYYERLPYINEPEGHITRFMSLSSVEEVTDKSKKWIHALSVSPFSQTSEDILKGKDIPSTVSPFLFIDAPKSINNVIPPSQDISMKRPDLNMQPNAKRMNFTPEQRAQLEREMKNQGNNNFFFSPPSAPQNISKHNIATDCWFCLSSKSSEKHLIASVGNYSYLALTKGPLTKDHLIIVPIEHVPSFTLLSSEAHEEVNKYLIAVRDYFRKQNKCLMVWERVLTAFNNNYNNNNYNNNNNRYRNNRRNGGSNSGPPPQIHTQYQCIPLDASAVNNVKVALDAAGSAKGIRFQTLDNNISLKDKVGTNDYLYTLVYPLEGDTPIQYLHVINDRKPNMQFFRQVALSLLGEETDKYDWKKVEESKEQETETCKLFKETFKEFDFTLNEDDE